MRTRIPSAVLVVVAALLGADLAVHLRSSSFPRLSGLPSATSGDIAMTAAVQQGGSDAWVFVYDRENQAIAQYRARRDGLQLTGVRRLTWDLQVIDWPGRHKPTVKEVREVVRKQQQQQQQSKPPGTPAGSK